MRGCSCAGGEEAPERGRPGHAGEAPPFQLGHRWVTLPPGALSHPGLPQPIGYQSSSFLKQEQHQPTLEWGSQVAQDHGREIGDTTQSVTEGSGWQEQKGGVPAQFVSPRLFTGAPASLFVLTRNFVRMWRALGSWQLLFRKGLGWLKAPWPLWLVNKFFEQVPPVFGPRFSRFWNGWPGRKGGLWCGPQRPQCPALHPTPFCSLINMD